MATAKTATKAAGKPKSGQVRLTLVKSKFGRLAAHKACVSGLGLRRMHQSVVVADTPENRGMINRIAYMLRVEQA
ncbi:MAG: 50S ribosomal protein L30 [Gammaproteobacteria bacterium]|jgi:large subunit ribosomal protein L30|nr:50S ribosomal protein L30 [Gammaproteobacteria bacterium]MDH5275148.1 50S ribosomal protein L30 [Gammaproteobacteria bacterium]